MSYGPAGLAIIVDCLVRAVDPSTGGVDATAPWFLGQAPWDWPYGPHTLVGTYRDLIVLHEQPSLEIVPEPTAEPTPEPPDRLVQGREIETLHERPHQAGTVVRRQQAIEIDRAHLELCPLRPLDARPAGRHRGLIIGCRGRQVEQLIHARIVAARIRHGNPLAERFTGSWSI